MSAYRLCQVRKAKHPYHIESIGRNIYTIEELCFYLRQNICLVDASIMNEELCVWLKEELGLARLSRKLMERLASAREGSMAGFVFPIFKEIGYLYPEEQQRLSEQIAGIEVQPEDIRRKLRADYLMRYGRYGNALREYYQVLKGRNPGNLGSQFYASVLDGMAAAYGRLFLFEEAADCLWQSYSCVRSHKTWEHYLAVLPLYLDKDAYKKRLKELAVPAEQVRRIEERTVGCLKPLYREKQPGDMKEFLAELKEEYKKCVSV